MHRVMTRIKTRKMQSYIVVLMAGKTQLLQKRAIKEITKTASKVRAEMEEYLEDLEMYSKPDFWQAINEAESGKVNTYKNMKEYALKMARK